MKLSIFTSLLAFVATTVFAGAGPEKAVMVSYPSDTPPSVIDDAMQAVKDAGGEITHKFGKGFAANAPAAALDTLSALSDKYRPWIEEDQMVTLDGKLTSGGNKL
ncbi:hypothetical protein ACJ73_08123 [Blastomyces percursus]|uniref:Inhibitor I9 domain-containing protein n=1 Tax=Blastomyces percursus TaxID=1658174 RepID=A0A1J9QWI5_9EURO|nr:hypothetical protein ACJ73_08123 [Blastomyces percursus]